MLNVWNSQCNHLREGILLCWQAFSDTIIYVDNGTLSEPHADGVMHLLRTPQTLVHYQDKCGVTLVQLGLPERTLKIEWLKGDRRKCDVYGVTFYGVTFVHLMA